MSFKTLPCGLVVAVIGRCCRELCPNAAEFCVTLESAHAWSYKHAGYCGECIEELFLSPEDYSKCVGSWINNGAGPGVFNRELYEIRPLTDAEAAEVAYEQAAPSRWEAEGRIGVYRRIVAFDIPETVEGVRVGTEAARCVVEVYNGLSPAHRQRFGGLGVHQQCQLAEQLVALESARPGFGRVRVPQHHAAEQLAALESASAE
ncbi:hypothetical protein [Streptomyces lydicus]|uniref:hypothetical protein n=1 Tax=Streptomyces lydicus TaxID=47763 RepID=UPI0036E936A3